MIEYHGKYEKLYRHLTGLTAWEWRATFGEVEAILGFILPNSARSYTAWWANDSSHSYARAWLAAGWETSSVNLQAGTLVFRKKR